MKVTEIGDTEVVDDIDVIDVDSSDDIVELVGFEGYDPEEDVIVLEFEDG